MDILHEKEFPIPTSLWFLVSTNQHGDEHYNAAATQLSGFPVLSMAFSPFHLIAVLRL